jgi:hypothetical protein
MSQLPSEKIVSSQAFQVLGKENDQANSKILTAR